MSPYIRPLTASAAPWRRYLQALGFPTDAFACTDVLATEDWALGMVPRPVVAVLFLYPIKEASEKHRAEEAERIRSQGGSLPRFACLVCEKSALTALHRCRSAGQTVSPNVFYMKQFVGNACGTIGLLHAACNAVDVAKPGEWRPARCCRARVLRAALTLSSPSAQWRAPSSTSL